MCRAFLENFSKGIICEMLNTLSAVEMLRDSALYKSTIDIDMTRAVILKFMTGWQLKGNAP